MIIRDFEFKYEDDNGHSNRRVFFGEYIDELVNITNDKIELALEFNADDFLDEDAVSFIDDIADHIACLAYPIVNDETEESESEYLRSVTHHPVEITCYSNNNHENTITIMCNVNSVDIHLTNDKLIAAVNIEIV